MDKLLTDLAESSVNIDAESGANMSDAEPIGVGSSDAGSH